MKKYKTPFYHACLNGGLFKNHIENEINQILSNLNFLTKITIMNYLSTIKLFIVYSLSIIIVYRTNR